MRKHDIVIATQGRHKQYEAKGIIKDNIVIVYKGSKIAPYNMKSKLDTIIENKRNDANVVDSDYVVINDIEFSSPSLAAQFVTGYICNGLRIWKTEDGNNLKKLYHERL